jgi:hypothetical protein
MKYENKYHLPPLTDVAVAHPPFQTLVTFRLKDGK